MKRDAHYEFTPSIRQSRDYPDEVELLFKRSYDPKYSNTSVERLSRDELRRVRTAIDAYFEMPGGDW